MSTRMAMIAKNNETGDHAVFGPVYTESGLNLMREVIEKRGGWTVVLTCPLISKAELTGVQMPRASRRRTGKHDPEMAVPLATALAESLRAVHRDQCPEGSEADGTARTKED